ncbi:hypothetical protein [Pyruvatibacter mobilis]|uniref:hypothetical protein n=1 Tax=Pyruvatibacter mobilis TaxID=1712261 RepID=UPI003BACAA5C
MRRPFEAAAILALVGLIAAPAAAEGWPRCWRDDDCPGFFLNVTTSQGDAKVSVGRACEGQWRHVWGQSDARDTIRQWLEGEAAGANGSLCIPLHPDVDEIRVTSTGGHCGESGFPDIAWANEPGADVVLRRGHGAAASATLVGCHARIGPSLDSGAVAYGGIALRFSDGYVFGDSYAETYFYGVYDGFGLSSVKPFGATVAAISEFNTYHYRVEILANGRDGWRWGDQEENDR